MNQSTTSIQIKNITLPNRLVMPPMATAKADENDHVSSDILAYYHEKSLGGHLSLIIIEHSYVSLQGKANPKQLSLASDDAIAPLTALSATIHQNGSFAFMQLNHAGSAAYEGTIDGIVGASSGIHPKTKLPFKEITQEQLQILVQEFKQAALRAQQAGFDGVELHSAHGYLLNQFYSPKTNHRTDSYGGDLEGRLKLHLEIIKAIKSVVREDFILALRFGACDYKEGGSTIDDAIKAAQIFEAAGIDLLDISGGIGGFTNPLSKEPGWFSDASTAIKQVVSIPVILTGGITTLTQANALLQANAADLIGIGRAVLEDSLWFSTQQNNKQ